MKKASKPRIVLPHGKKQMMCRDLGVSPETVRRALQFISESEEGDRIRREALDNYGGTLITLKVNI